MRPLIRAVVLGLVGYVAGAWLTVAVRGGSPSDDVAVVFGFILGLIGWLMGIGVWNAWAREWFGLPAKPDQATGWKRYLTFNTRNRRELIRITDEVADAVRESGIREGFVLVSAMHITAGVIVNDDEEGFFQDFWELMEKLAPYRPDYHHHRTGEDNGDAHLRSILVHHQVIVPVTDGRLDLGPWQEIFYAEFDGQRPKRLIIKVLGE